MFPCIVLFDVGVFSGFRKFENPLVCKDFLFASQCHSAHLNCWLTITEKHDLAPFDIQIIFHIIDGQSFALVRMVHSNSGEISGFFQSRVLVISRFSVFLNAVFLYLHWWQIR